jgi:hypothetical protein
MSTPIDDVDKAAQRLVSEARKVSKAQEWDELYDDPASSSGRLRSPAAVSKPLTPTPLEDPKRLPLASDDLMAPPEPTKAKAKQPAEPMERVEPAAIALAEPAPPAQPIAPQKAIDTAVRAYHDTLRYLLLAGLLVAAGYIAAGVAQGWETGAYEPSVLVATTAAGCLGALVSALTRLFNYRYFTLRVSFDHLYMGVLRKLAYSLAPLFIGAIGAVVLYLVFASGLVRGPVIPEFACSSSGGCLTLGSLLNNLGPSTTADLAKTLIWCFIAGFSERLTPDLLGNFVKTGRAPQAI